MRTLFLLGYLCLFVNAGFAQEADSVKQYDLDEVLISTTRTNTPLKNIPQKVEIINGVALQSNPLNTVADVLKSNTNLDIIQYPGLSAAIGMRGFSPSSHARSYTLILMNGKPMGTNNLSCLDTENIERIEVVKGPYSILYGSDALGGVINIITTKPSGKNEGSASVGVGSTGNFKLSGNVSGAISPKTIFRIGFTRNEQNTDYRIGSKNLLALSDQDKLLLDKASYGDIMKNSSWQYNQVSGLFNYTINQVWQSNIEAIYFNANDVETPGNYWGSYGQSKKDIDRINLYGTLSRNKNGNAFSFSPYFTKESNANYTNNSDTGYVSFDSYISEYGYKMHGSIQIGNYKLLAGSDLDVYDYQSERFKDKATPTSPYKPNHQNAKTAVFSQLNYSAKGLDINAGLRYNHIAYHIDKNDSLQGTGGEESYQAFNPSAGIQYTFPFNLKLHSSYGTAFSVPDAFKVAGYYGISEYLSAWDYWYVKDYIGNPDLKPESSSTIDIGLSYALPNKLISFDISYFTTTHTDRIIETTLDSVVVNRNEVKYNVTSYKNANSSAMNGVELVASGNIGALFNNRFKLELYGNVTYMLNNKVDELLVSSHGADSVVTHDLKYARKCNANFGIQYDNYKGFTTRLHARYIGSRLEQDRFSKLRPELTSDDYYTGGGYIAADAIFKHPEYIVFDYSIFYTLTNYRFGITISNLLDENYTEKDGYNMPGRTLMANLKYSF